MKTRAAAFSLFFLALFCLTLFFLTLFCLTWQNAYASTKPGDLCWRAIDQAAADSRAPVALLRAIALVESGRGSGKNWAPWPWTINIAGKSHYFDSREKGIAFAKKAISQGRTSFDVGCLQVNYKWHGGAFTNVEAMFDPQKNAAYAARFLLELKEETGEWLKASGYYHSRTKKHFDRYTGKILETLAALNPESTTSPIGAMTSKSGAKELEDALLAGYTRLEPDQSDLGESDYVAAQRAKRLSPLRKSVWRGLLRSAAGMLIRLPTTAQPAAVPTNAHAPSGSLATALTQQPSGSLTMNLMHRARKPHTTP
jgi:hypothetical protein